MKNTYTSSRTLIPELQTRWEALQAIQQEARTLTAGLTHDQFNWRPAPERWSIAQCLDHLNVAGFLLLPYLERAVEEARERGMQAEGPFHYSLIGRFFVYLMKPNPRLRIPTPGMYTPSMEHAAEVVVPRFQELQRRLVEVVESAHGLDLRAVRVASPVSRLMRFSLGIWFAATTAHEQRHLVQAQKVKQHPSFPA